MSFGAREPCPGEPSPNSERATLGRATWKTFHSTADALKNTPEDLSNFVTIVQKGVAEYACPTCKSNARRDCGYLLRWPRLWWRQLLYGRSSRVVASAWVARLHACVTTHLIADKSGYVSELSTRFAAKVREVDEDVSKDEGEKDDILAELGQAGEILKRQLATS